MSVLFLLVAGLAPSVLCCRPAMAQQAESATLRLGGVIPGGVRNSATTSWGAYTFNLTNFSDTDRRARVLVFYKDAPEVQYGRDVWVPARAALSTWMLVGPAPADLPGMACDVEMVVNDLSGGEDQTLLPATEERLRSRGVLYRRREPTTAILLDDDPPEKAEPGQLPRPESRGEEAVELVRVARHSRGLSELVQVINPGPLPPTAEAFDGVDHVVLASGRLARDPAGVSALRHWLEQGGKVWVMLDLVEPDGLAALLGDALDFQVVGRAGLTTYPIETHPKGKVSADPPVRHHERPVAFVRVQLPPQEQVRNTLDGWPVWFTRRVGRGEVLFSALGPRGWHRPRTQRDGPSPFPNSPELPVALPHLQDFGLKFQPSAKESPFQVEALEPILAAEIGYSVVSRGTVVLVFTAALLAALLLGAVLRRSSRPELLGWLGPAAALGATVVFLVVGERSRRAVPPTLAVAQVVEAVSGEDEAAVHGLLEVYRPEPGPVEAGARRGGLFQLDLPDMRDQVRQFVLTDLDAWHWERLSLLAEPRKAPFRVTVPTEKRIAALARFGPEGVEGRFSGPLANVADALLSTPTGRKLAVHLRPDGTFRCATSDALPKGQYLSGTVWTDRQQRRQRLYGEFLKEPEPASVRGRNVLLAWADPLDTGFRIAPGARVAGGALVVAPLRLERLPAGERATIPGAFLPYQRLLDGYPVRPILDGSEDVQMHLRFQLPAEVLPFEVERARLFTRIEAPGRRVAVAAHDGDRLSEVHHLDSPLDPLRVEIADPRLLRVDEEGGLHLTVTLGAPPQGEATRREIPGPPPPPGGRPPPVRPGGAPPAVKDGWGERWTIHELELEVSGRATDERR